MTTPAIFQLVHVAHGTPRLVKAHAALIDRASRELFGCAYAPDPFELERRLAAAARAARFPQRVSGFLRIEWTAEGEERIAPAGVSLYDGYALRSLRPDAVVMRYDNPVADWPTTAREGVARLADRAAARQGASVAVRADGGGRLLTASDAPLFALMGRTLLACPAPESVEGDLVRRAARAAGIAVEEEAIDETTLGRCDELLFADVRGVTAIAHCGGFAFMDLAARRLAASMEALFTART